MLYRPNSLLLAAAFAATFAVSETTVRAQQSETPSCAERMTQQLRRFSDKCLSDVVSFVASHPKMAAKIYSEKEKYYIMLTESGDGILAEAVSKYNYPLMKDETAEVLKQLGWAAPENESDNWKKKIASDVVKSGAAAEDIRKALTAYGLQQGEALSLTVGTDISG